MLTFYTTSPKEGEWRYHRLAKLPPNLKKIRPLRKLVTDEKVVRETMRVGAAWGVAMCYSYI
ncbi:hypothetical protein NXV38_21735 [Bacteroides caccae]|nr:hypothetical protein [Bacteroides caccae]